MSKKNFLPFLVMAAILMALASCSGKLKPLSAQYIQADPQPLEAVGGQVPVTISIAYPAKWFKKNATLTITPVLRYPGGETWGTAYTFQGEKVRANNQVIPYGTGGNVTMKSSFKYKPEMKRSELYLTFDVKIGNKSSRLPDIKIADGVIATSALANAATANPAVGADKFQRIIKEAYDANILFLIQQAELRSNELSKGELKDWKDRVKQANDAANQNVSVEVSAYASPDGGLSLNESLAERREANTTRYLKGELNKRKIDVPVGAHYTAQDWEGFKQLVEQSNFQDKDLVLRVLSMYPDPEQREHEIRNISAVFSKLADEVLPKLRRSRLIANVKIIGKSDAEIQDMLEKYPSALTVEELLYAATLSDDAAQKESIYKLTMQKYPKDYRSYNNVGSLCLQRGDYESAHVWFDRALKLKDNAEAKVNLGLLALKDGDLSKATSLIAEGSALPGVGDALGYLYLRQGDYAKAETAYGDVTTNNAAVAQILNRNYSKAIKTLEAIAKPDATTDYLRAIVATRMGDTSLAISSLQKALQKDPSLASRIDYDLEFARLRGMRDFSQLLRLH